MKFITNIIIWLSIIGTVNLTCIAQTQASTDEPVYTNSENQQNQNTKVEPLNFDEQQQLDSKAFDKEEIYTQEQN